ncbi:hypothetical protein LOTGIDRAFT_135767, partial [Lottia gigantea]
LHTYHCYSDSILLLASYLPLLPCLHTTVSFILTTITLTPYYRKLHTYHCYSDSILLLAPHLSQLP